ncbi:hypothetical protein [Naasia aerilata]|uniref:Uncharacterized protein n=1 Tax=Naasia aerilata TaxID=1162966 RepID=A0ABM8GGQ1_9MICO|nr:hypothetical protein [Naasia aerilata]BDZ47525.1 hypothetical protein GCM10025866_34340 [Naasia aerilata]
MTEDIAETLAELEARPLAERAERYVALLDRLRQELENPDGPAAR